MSRDTLASFKRTVTVNWPKATEANARAHLLKVAREGHQRIMQEQTSRASIAPDWDAWADTYGNENLESVKNTIVYVYRYLREVVAIALDALKQASPLVTGEYIRSHKIYYNGNQVSGDQLNVKIKGGDEVMLVNVAPYARKIEVGKTKSGRPFVIQVENRIYERTAKIIKSRYGRVADVESTFVNISGAYQLKRSTGRRGRGAGTALTYPAIIIKQRG